MSDQPGATKPIRGATRLLKDILGDLDRLSAARLADHAPGAETRAQSDADARGPTASLGDVLDRLDERAFGLLLLLLALPCCLPFVYVLPQIVALPMLALAGQLALGKRTPWFPEKLRRRSFVVRDFRNVLDRSEKYLGWVERLASPRLRAVTGHGGARFVGAILLVPIASILMPLPGTNTIPGIGVAIAALGLIERDGVLVILGLLVGFLWVALLLTLGLEAASLIKAWVSARF
ncbi:MAG: exopolysaccharide biosynthesis protein [Amphiplicatus sp.]